MSDAELIALAALTSVEAVVMQGDNRYCEASGYLPQWKEGTGLPPHTTKLIEELQRRTQTVLSESNLTITQNQLVLLKRQHQIEIENLVALNKALREKLEAVSKSPIN